MQNFVKKTIAQNMHIIILKMKRKNYIVNNIKKKTWYSLELSYKIKSTCI